MQISRGWQLQTKTNHSLCVENSYFSICLKMITTTGLLSNVSYTKKGGWRRDRARERGLWITIETIWLFLGKNKWITVTVGLQRTLAKSLQNTVSTLSSVCPRDSGGGTCVYFVIVCVCVCVCLCLSMYMQPLCKCLCKLCAGAQ